MKYFQLSLFPENTINQGDIAPPTTQLKPVTKKPKPQLTPDQYKSIESAIADLPEWERIPEINHEWTNHSAKYIERIA